ncbi:MAG TPA: aminotransferase class I/II-fold pyridoxal phosphate-dependent enzyme [Chloroflexota bacterium]|nr:aminotransferase class I/II-fold pyridoxal phosphate-dependent enzyme [Chloroflexota bacterium]
MQFNPVLAGMQRYPYLKLDEQKAEVAARGIRILDFGEGDPREPTDSRILQALVDALPGVSGYPRAVGLRALREAISGWYERRFSATFDPEREIIPTSGSKEVLFSLPQVLVDAHGQRNVVLVPEPAYPIYERGALFAGAQVVKMPLLEERGFLPDLSALDPALLDRVALCWVNYPNNPTAAVAPLSFYEQAAELARRHDFLLASDEAYGEIYFGDPPASASQVGDHRNLAVVTTLSKRSSMTGYRSGSVAADAQLINALRLYRPMVGATPQEFTQLAAAWAWADEDHVCRMREAYAAKRALFVDLFQRKGIRLAGGEATFYLWLAVPAGFTSESFAQHLLQVGVLVSPGPFFGPSGEGYVRLALVPTLDTCREAADLLDRAL